MISFKFVFFLLNSHIEMKLKVKIGITLLAMVWIGLIYLMISAGGITLKNILIIVMSGIIIFVPLWKKYVRGTKNR